jgi:hypothetical protein
MRNLKSTESLYLSKIDKFRFIAKDPLPTDPFPVVKVLIIGKSKVFELRGLIG